MKKKTNKLMAAVLAMVMLVSMLSMGVMAAPYDTTKLNPEQETGLLILMESDGVKEKADSEYTAYKVLDATVPAEGQDVYEYEMAGAFKPFFKVNRDVTVDSISGMLNGPTDYTIDSATVDSLAAKLENYVTENAVTGTTMTVGEPTQLEIGYYLVLETTIADGGYKQTKPILVAIPSRTNGEDGSITYNYIVEVTLKDQPITTVKKIVDGDLLLDSISKQVGKEYTYQVQQDVPKYDDTYNNVVFRVTDTMSVGLDFVEVDSVLAVKESPTEEDPDHVDTTTLTVNESYGFSSSKSEETKTTTLVFDFSDTSKTQGKDYYDSVKDADYVLITYTAKLNKDATFGPGGNMNEVVPTIGPNPGTEKDGEKDRTKTYAGLLELTKEDGADHALAGAEFTVYTDDTCTEEAELVTYKVDEKGNITTDRNDSLSATATTDKDGIVRFEGLGAGTYYIKETKAPTGYVVLKNPIKVEVEVKLPDNIKDGTETATFTYKVEGNGVDTTSVKTDTTSGKVSFTVNNTKGFTLPTTGGMGTYLFVIGGVALILLAGVLFLRSRKNEK